MTEKPARGQETAKAVLDIIRMNPEQHDQSSWEWKDREDECGTTRCVAGWAAHLHGYNVRNALVNTGMVRLGCKLLDIDTITGTQLFSGTSDKEAVHALEYLAKGDSIDWKVVYEDSDEYEG